MNSSVSQRALNRSSGVLGPLDRKTIESRTDAYFGRTRQIVEHFGDSRVTYAVFIRRPVIAACGIAVTWLRNVAKEQGFDLQVREVYEEGQWVGAGEPILYLTGPFSRLAPLETLLLQRLGACCVAAHNAYQMAMALPDVAFLAMEARHCAGFEMQEQMGYAAAVGSQAAQKEGARGFIGNANDATAGFFGQDHGLGTMPHALIGYAGSTLRAAEMYVDVYPNDPLTILVDYFGQEVTDALEVCHRFPEKAAAGQLSVRLDTHGGRFLEGLDPQSSYAVLERYTPGTIRRYRSDAELRDLVGTGVSAAAIWRMREALDEAGFPKVKITVSSGFNASKCTTMRDAHAPIDVVGSGSFIPDRWSETYATADIVAYDGTLRVKVGREFLLNKARAEQGAS
ncbi:nicotinic acid phosphoribosyltransferase [Gluconobacter thailandicus F149-1 = NBRC 100600]|uniref:Nicotinic acid phosphoribosyltransferase n=1 Tax=Gluconobacter thailandicus NBRC 3257 TaxID=1381097 RepID=A0ABQ0IYE3_GLUTH|nr:nicotinic acid phosphoribosyltransferase [Gluconobacter thailandicus]KXV53585.1 nicotinate phosphoribosyltransferase [Gluconobacter thailandicus]GAC88479.1 nicotinic acid phosphoribosyltransferase [Gluconobacter thailandicus NBRC 3255]GAD27232.1 nicotinic acid phosphoribosyltransferase [Gluconobacter thailandicus NBRC 3257]GAN94121.1 nicotinic acid phosphoribosyltransferase [Gluconobacter thailandicus F149-1 = NBRC 100600]GBR58279.1 nicotinic acid phosphoribosyltransferase [Gluconobacter th